MEKGAGHRLTGRRTSQAKGAGGSVSTSASTTPRASPTGEVLADEKVITSIGFLKRATAFYAAHGIEVER
jgi:hypothetical protein